MAVLGALASFEVMIAKQRPASPLVFFIVYDQKGLELFKRTSIIETRVKAKPSQSSSKLRNEPPSYSIEMASPNPGSRDKGTPRLRVETRKVTLGWACWLTSSEFHQVRDKGVFVVLYNGKQIHFDPHVP